MEYRKGMWGEELPASIFTIILLFVFLFSILNFYSNSLGKTDFIEQKRISSSIVESIYFENNGVISNPTVVLDSKKNLANINITITDIPTGKIWNWGNIWPNVSSVSVSSLSLLINNSPGKVDVHVGK